MNNESKKRSNAGLIIIIVILILIIAIMGTVIIKNYYSTNNEKKLQSNTKDTKVINKIDINKEYVYDAEYNNKDVKDSYADFWKTNRYASDLVFPYLNVNTDIAKQINDEIKKIYDKVILEYKELSEMDGTYSWIFSNYYYNIYNDIISIVIDVEYSGTDVSKHTYYTYNYDLKNNSNLSYKELYNQLKDKDYDIKFDDNNINELVKQAIKNNVRTFSYTQDDYKKYFELDVENSYKDYEESLSNNKLLYFVDSYGRLNIITKIYYPAGVGSSYEITTVNGVGHILK